MKAPICSSSRAASDRSGSPRSHRYRRTSYPYCLPLFPQKPPMVSAGDDRQDTPRRRENVPLIPTHHPAPIRRPAHGPGHRSGNRAHTATGGRVVSAATPLPCSSAASIICRACLGDKRECLPCRDSGTPCGSTARSRAVRDRGNGTQKHLGTASVIPQPDRPIFIHRDMHSGGNQF